MWSGWFLTDSGSHGEPRDGLQVGALGWLMGHGSGVMVDGVRVTAVPLLLTMVAAWATWRIGHRIGDSISGHGPDADAISDGERDWTVPVALAFFTAGYVLVTVITATLAATPTTSPHTGRAVLWSVLISIGFGGPALAVGSGRAAIWAAFVPVSVRAAATTCRTILVWYAAAAALALVIALAVDFGTAVNVLSQLHLDGGEATLFLLATALVLPNAVFFSGSYLLGPGFAVGTHTVVSPTVVAMGPLPMFPLLAALPDNGPASGWTTALMVVPPVVAGAGRRPGAAPPPHHPLGGGRAPWLYGRRARGSRRRPARDDRRRSRRPRPDAARRAVRVRRAGARDHGVRHRWPLRRAGHDLVVPTLAAPGGRRGLTGVPG